MATGQPSPPQRCYSCPNQGTHTARQAPVWIPHRHVADLRLEEMIFLQAQSDGRAAFLVFNQACSRDITNLELTALNQDFDNSNIEADVGVTSDSITLFSRHLNGINARRPEGMRKDENDLTSRQRWQWTHSKKFVQHLRSACTRTQ